MTRRTANTSADKKPIDLLSGWPNPSLLPPLELNTSATNILTDSFTSTQALRYNPDEGYRPLREELAKWLTKFYRSDDSDSASTVYSRQPSVQLEDIAITGGASQNLACVLQTFTDPSYTRNIWMVAPTYFLACRVFDDNGFSGRLRAVPEDPEGIDIAYLEHHIAKSEADAIRKGMKTPTLKTLYPWRKVYKHIIYCVPTFANPSGRVMSLRRREQLVLLARCYDALVITDDVYDMLLWPTNSASNSSCIRRPTTKAVLPRLIDVDRILPTTAQTSERWGNTISNGSFSKIVAPGCRTGWAEAFPKLSWALSQCGSSRSGGAPSSLVAALLSDMLARGILQKHIAETLLPEYEHRWRSVVSVIEKRLVPLGVTITVPKSKSTIEPSVALDTKQNENIAGGYFIWLTLPKPCSAEMVRKRCEEAEDLKILSGKLVRVQGDETNPDTQFDRNVRICFSYEQFELLEEGITRLARVIQSELTKMDGA